MTVASEGKQRERMKTDLQDIQISAEAIPFSFPVKRGQEIRLAPLACVTDLTSVIFHLLDERERCSNQLCSIIF